ncbi:IS110 family transposase [Roseomonas stagni]|uniref:IS110 family transposase n=1 Tax=Falsiroseomonas algicola TaxID=2716930 RepID=A0A6M1LWS0_9PROT|nr:IS110 family transposase [Falsiroseomonas algicola]NGM24422.1 IS110 family transposase [Falsiroseomonas algicola]
MKITTIGLDIAKRAFQAHGVDASGRAVLRRKLGRSEVLGFFRALPPCLVGIEACGSAHHWAREIRALGHEVRLIPAAYVKPYVKRGKTDAADAEAICEAVTRPTMRFVPIKTPEQQALLVLHRTRDLLVRQRTMLVNSLRGHLAEFGIVARQGTGGMGELLGILRDAAETRVPALARTALLRLADAIEAIETQVAEVEAAILAWHKASEASRRLAKVPGIGPITATAILASVGDIANFRSARHLAAWIGLVPKQDSTGGKPRQVGISKAGDRYLRKLLVLGATTVIRHNKNKAQEGWLAGLLARRPTMVAAIAQANKTARIVWALLTRGGTYDPTLGRQAAAA